MTTYLMAIFFILCSSFFIFPDDALSNRSNINNRNPNLLNASRNSSESSGLLRKHVGRQRNRPSVRTRGNGQIELTRTPTNTKLIRLFCRVGFFLHVSENGTVSGSINQNSNYVKLELQSFATSIVRIRSVETGFFIAMDSRGMLYAKNESTDECFFFQNHEENLFVSFASYKYYMREHYDMFLSLKRNGEFKQATSTLPGQDAIQFLTLNSMEWDFGNSGFNR